jgi:tRNA pseudouridine32 synthase/23S rRNA pseudouridine746 synthase
MTPEEMLARLLYRDGLMLVVDKPAGLPVHRGPKGGDAFEDYFDALRFGLPRAPALAHRLDRDTTGCLVLGRHRKALALLGKLFKQGKVRALLGRRRRRTRSRRDKSISRFPSATIARLVDEG